MLPDLGYVETFLKKNTVFLSFTAILAFSEIVAAKDMPLPIRLSLYMLTPIRDLSN
jgi:hypothetical protein